MKLFKNSILGTGLFLVTILATSCGGHTLCDAYGYLEYKKETKEVNSTPILENEYILEESGTL
jgi:hypothetical protein